MLTIRFKRKNPYHDIGFLTVADSVGDSFQPGYIPQQIPLHVSHDSAGAICPPMPLMDDQSLFFVPPCHLD